MVEHQPSKLNTWVRFPSPARRKARSGDLVFSISMRELESRGLVYTSYTQKASKLLLRASFDAFFIYKFVIWHQNLQQFLFLMLYALNALPVWHQNSQQFLFLMLYALNALPVWHQNSQQFLFLMPSALNNISIIRSSLFSNMGICILYKNDTLNADFHNPQLYT